MYNISFSDLDIKDLVGGKEIADRIWLPDTFFVNERSSEFKETFLKISKDGTVLYSRRTRVTFTEVGSRLLSCLNPFNIS